MQVGRVVDEGEPFEGVVVRGGALPELSTIRQEVQRVGRYMERGSKRQQKMLTACWGAGEPLMTPLPTPHLKKHPKKKNQLPKKENIRVPCGRVTVQR